MSTALVVASPGLTVGAFSDATGLHPDLVKRLVALGSALMPAGPRPAS